MVLDTSVLIAILKQEDGYQDYLDRIIDAHRRVISAFTLLEAAVVWFGWTRNYDAVAHFYKLVEELRIEVVPFTSEMAELAFQAYRTYGKGINPPGLNLGDCAVWATARHHGMRVLHVGEEFTRADIGV
jgi:ribonuclease VapC